MSAKTGIAWTDHTFNPWWGCVRVSPGCEQCYAERDSKRYGFKLWGPTSDRRFFGEKHWNEPRRWNRRAMADLGRPARVFCASMADVFEDRRDLDEPRARLFALIEETTDLRWQLLTKRPENAERLVPPAWREAWPDNAWALVTAEDQQRADERIPLLLRIPARVRGVSYEPALGPVDLRPVTDRAYRLLWPFYYRGRFDADGAESAPPPPDRRPDLFPKLDWLIVGGESGHHARPFDVAWARSAVDQCRAAGVSVFVKQLGAQCRMNRTDAVQPVAIGGAGWDAEGPGAEHGLVHFHGAGADPIEWPVDLRVREFPA